MRWVAILRSKSAWEVWCTNLQVVCVGVLVLAVGLVGCGGGRLTEGATPIFTETVTRSPTVIVPTETMRQTLTATGTPAWTQTPTLTNTPTTTATPSPSTTHPPTLEPEQAVQTIMVLMHEPSAPCFWGICPGQTTLEEAKSIFTHLGLDIEHTATQDEYEYYYVVLLDLENGLEINFLLAVQDNVIKSFEISIHPEEEQPDVPREWLAFSPETLILHYGTPSKVEYSVGGGPRPQYSMVVYYDATDLIIQYHSFKDSYNRATNSFHICPLTDQYRHVMI